MTHSSFDPTISKLPSSLLHLQNIAEAPRGSYWRATGQGKFQKVDLHFFGIIWEKIRGILGLGDRTHITVKQYEFIGILLKNMTGSLHANFHAIKQAAIKAGILPENEALWNTEPLKDIKAILQAIAKNNLTKEMLIQQETTYYTKYQKHLKPIFKLTPTSVPAGQIFPELAKIELRAKIKSQEEAATEDEKPSTQEEQPAFDTSPKDSNSKQGTRENEQHFGTNDPRPHQQPQRPIEELHIPVSNNKPIAETILPVKIEKPLELLSDLIDPIEPSSSNWMVKAGVISSIVVSALSIAAYTIFSAKSEDFVPTDNLDKLDPLGTCPNPFSNLTLQPPILTKKTDFITPFTSPNKIVPLFPANQQISPANNGTCVAKENAQNISLELSYNHNLKSLFPSLPDNQPQERYQIRHLKIDQDMCALRNVSATPQPTSLLSTAHLHTTIASFTPPNNPPLSVIEPSTHVAVESPATDTQPISNKEMCSIGNVSAALQPTSLVSTTHLHMTTASFIPPNNPPLSVIEPSTPVAVESPATDTQPISHTEPSNAPQSNFEPSYIKANGLFLGTISSLLTALAVGGYSLFRKKESQEEPIDTVTTQPQPDFQVANKPTTPSTQKPNATQPETPSKSHDKQAPRRKARRNQLDEPTDTPTTPPQPTGTGVSKQAASPQIVLDASSSINSHPGTPRKEEPKSAPLTPSNSYIVNDPVKIEAQKNWQLITKKNEDEPYELVNLFTPIQIVGVAARIAPESENKENLASSTRTKKPDGTPEKKAPLNLIVNQVQSRQQPGNPTTTSYDPSKATPVENKPQVKSAQSKDSPLPVVTEITTDSEQPEESPQPAIPMHIVAPEVDKKSTSDAADPQRDALLQLIQPDEKGEYPLANQLLNLKGGKEKNDLLEDIQKLPLGEWLIPVLDVAINNKISSKSQIILELIIKASAEGIENEVFQEAISRLSLKNEQINLVLREAFMKAPPVTLEIILALIQKLSAEEINKPDMDMNTLLHDLISNPGHPNAIEILKMLLRQGANVNSVNNQSMTAIHQAAFYVKSKIFRYLIEDENVDWSQINSEFIQTQFKDDSELLNDFNEREKVARAASTSAAISENEDSEYDASLQAILQLVQRDKNGQYPLVRRFNFKTRDEREELLNDIEVLQLDDGDGNWLIPVLRIAIQTKTPGMSPVILALLTKLSAANVGKKVLQDIIEELPNGRLNPILREAFKIKDSSDRAELILQLIEKLSYQEINAQDKEEKTLLHDFITHYKNDDVTILEALLKKGANINRVDKHSKTPIHYAAHAGGAKNKIFNCLIRQENVDWVINTPSKLRTLLKTPKAIAFLDSFLASPEGEKRTKETPSRLPSSPSKTNYLSWNSPGKPLERTSLGIGSSKFLITPRKITPNEDTPSSLPRSPYTPYTYKAAKGSNLKNSIEKNPGVQRQINFNEYAEDSTEVAREKTDSPLFQVTEAPPQNREQKVEGIREENNSPSVHSSPLKKAQSTPLSNPPSAQLTASSPKYPRSRSQSPLQRVLKSVAQQMQTETECPKPEINLEGENPSWVFDKKDGHLIIEQLIRNATPKTACSVAKRISQIPEGHKAITKAFPIALEVGIFEILLAVLQKMSSEELNHRDENEKTLLHQIISKFKGKDFVNIADNPIEEEIERDKICVKIADTLLKKDIKLDVKDSSSLLEMALGQNLPLLFCKLVDLGLDPTLPSSEGKLPLVDGLLSVSSRRDPRTAFLTMIKGLAEPNKWLSKTISAIERREILKALFAKTIEIEIENPSVHKLESDCELVKSLESARKQLLTEIPSEIEDSFNLESALSLIENLKKHIAEQNWANDDSELSLLELAATKKHEQLIESLDALIPQSTSNDSFNSSKFINECKELIERSDDKFLAQISAVLYPIENAGKTILVDAFLNESHSLISPLIAMGCSLDTKDDDGLTAYEYALAYGSEESLSILFNEANINKCDEESMTPLNRAIYYVLKGVVGDTSAIETLKSIGANFTVTEGQAESAHDFTKRLLADVKDAYQNEFNILKNKLVAYKNDFSIADIQTAESRKEFHEAIKDIVTFFNRGRDKLLATEQDKLLATELVDVLENLMYQDCILSMLSEVNSIFDNENEDDLKFVNVTSAMENASDKLDNSFDIKSPPQSPAKQKGFKIPPARKNSPRKMKLYGRNY